MDCGHDTSGMMACTMSCCHDSDRSLVTSIAFLLPPSVAVDAAAAKAACSAPRLAPGSTVVHAVDERFIAEARAVHAISKEVVDRLKDFPNVDRKPLYPPPERPETFHGVIRLDVRNEALETHYIDQLELRLGCRAINPFQENEIP